MLQQQAEHHSQKQEKAGTAMTMTTGYPGNSQRKRQETNMPQNQKSAKNGKE
jgi:hypothetical protein